MLTLHFHTRATTPKVFQSSIYSLSKNLGIFFAWKIQTIDLSLISPLMKCRSCFVVF